MKATYFFGAIEIDGFIDKDELQNRSMNGSAFSQHQTGSGSRGPLIPGNPKGEAEAIRIKEGIPLLKPVVDDLLEIAEKTGIPFEISRVI